MSEQNKQIARRFVDAFVAGDSTILAEVVAVDFVDHNSKPGQEFGRQSMIDASAFFRAGFPDLEITIEREIAEGDMVVQYGMITGTNKGEMMGKPATNKRAEFAYMDMHRIVGGQIAETWHLEDIVAMLGQLGLDSA